MYRIEKDQPFSVTLSSLSAAYVLPKKMKIDFVFLVKFWMFRIFGFIFGFVFPLHHLVTSIQDHLEVDISEDLSFTVGGAGALINCYLFMLQTPNWVDFINDVTDFNRFGKHSDFEKIKNTLNLISKVFVWYVICGLFAGLGITYLDKENCMKMNEEKDLHELCGLLMPIRLPFDVNTLPVRVLLTVAQMSSFAVTMIPGGLLSFLVFESTEIFLTHVCLLKERFVEIFDTENDQEKSERLRFCINFHNHVLSLAKRLNHLVKFTSGHMSLISAIIFACIGNQIFKSKPLNAILYLCGYMVALFWLCHSGQRIVDETASVGDAVYDSKWYNADAKMMRDVTVILMRCQRPATLEALPLGSLDYPLYLMILKTAYSYLTLLNQTT